MPRRKKDPFFTRELPPDLAIMDFAHAATEAFNVIQHTEHPQHTLAFYGMRGDEWNEILDTFMQRVTMDQSGTLEDMDDMENIYDTLSEDQAESLMACLTWTLTIGMILGYELRMRVEKKA